MHRILSAFAIAACTLLAGCHSASVEATISNHSGSAIRVLEVDYPSASFGTSLLANGADFHYRFKIQGSGPIKLSFMDLQGHDHQATGPELNEGQEGSLRADILTTGVKWTPSLTTPR